MTVKYLISKEYVSPAPEFSLEEGSYDEVQQVTLYSDGRNDLLYDRWVRTDDCQYKY